MSKHSLGVAVALAVSVALVASSVILTTTSLFSDRWLADLLAVVALFAAIVVAGASIRRHRKQG